MAKIQAIQAREILDSRGIPTIETAIWLDTGHYAVASVPSGITAGNYEALELRDKDEDRFGGMGVLKAVNNVNTIIAPKVIGQDPGNQGQIDQILIDLDGTENKAKLGANAILSVSQAVCEVAAASVNYPLYNYLIAKYQLTKSAFPLPTSIFNVINGGKHGAGNLDFQEFHIIPAKHLSYSAGLQCGEEIYQQLGEVLKRRGAIHSVGTEGGYAPNLFTNSDALEVIVECIKETKYTLNRDIFLGLDVAAGHFYAEGQYKIRDTAKAHDSQSLINYYKQINSQYRLVSLEDPLQEDDWTGWSNATLELGSTTTIIGDDLLGTNKKRLQKAIQLKACTGILVKPNQVGTISETIEVIKTAKQNNFKIVVSHRSGETNDDFIADFAVGVGADHTKFGAPARGERVIKYNRLLKIEQEVNQQKSQ